MKTIEKSILVLHSAQQMFDLVSAVDRYTEFLPWCASSRIVSLHDDGMTAEIGMAYGKLTQSFTTRNTHILGREIHLKLEKGPFSQLEGTWRFTLIGSLEDNACRTEFKIQYATENSILGKLIAPFFDKIAASLVDAFFNRANELYN